MARQKKIVKFVPNTKFPLKRQNIVSIMLDPARGYTLQNIKDMCVVRGSQKHNHYYGVREDGTPYTVKEYYDERFNRWEVNEDNFRSVVKSNWNLERCVEYAYFASPAFDEVNEQFLKEYDEREDLQDFYKQFFNSSYWLHDRYGNSLQVNQYSSTEEERSAAEALTERYRNRPETYLMFNTVTSHHEAARYREVNRDTPYEPGDLVKLRDPYIGHDGHDPLWVSNFDVIHRGATPTPGKEVERIGTVMKVTSETRRWRSGKGSKLIEVLWFGKDSTEHVAEKVIKWHERPTKKNGMVK